jgi:predicted HTH domain antitoxin
MARVPLIQMSKSLHFDREVPDEVLDEPFRSELVATVKRETVLQLFAEGKISPGYGAKMLGMTRCSFQELFGLPQDPLYNL